MYKGKSIKAMNNKQMLRMNQILMKNNIDMNNIPNVNELIRQQQKKSRQNKNNNMPYSWANNTLAINSSQNNLNRINNNRDNNLNNNRDNNNRDNNNNNRENNRMNIGNNGYNNVYQDIQIQARQYNNNDRQYNNDNDRYNNNEYNNNESITISRQQISRNGYNRQFNKSHNIINNNELNNNNNYQFNNNNNNSNNSNTKSNSNNKLNNINKSNNSNNNKSNNNNKIDSNQTQLFSWINNKITHNNNNHQINHQNHYNHYNNQNNHKLDQSHNITHINNYNNNNSNHINNHINNNNNNHNNNNNNNNRTIQQTIKRNQNLSLIQELFQDSNSIQSNHYNHNNNYTPNINNQYINQSNHFNNINHQNNHINNYNNQPNHYNNQSSYQQNNQLNNNKSYQHKQTNNTNLSQFQKLLQRNNKPINNHQYQQPNITHNNNNNYSNYNQYQNNTLQFQTNNTYQNHNNKNKIRPKDLFRKQRQGKIQEQPIQKYKKNNQQLCQLQQCKPNSKLITLKILQPIGPLVRNYQIGDVTMWELNSKFSDKTLKDALKNFPHVKQFKNNQKAIIKCALNGNDVFTCIPTGGGKSLIFQLMTFIKKGIYLCVLPLISLIYDQQLQAHKYNIEAYSLTGATQANRSKNVYDKIKNYTPDQRSILIFCTPQKIAASQSFIELLQNKYWEGYMQCVVIDEVHCVATWGKQFRKQYQNLSYIKGFFPKTPILGLTATVTEVIKQEIIKKLKLTKCYYFQSSFNRPNLMYQVRVKSKKSAIDEICTILKSHKQDSGIIYCLSKRQCQQMCKDLNSRYYKTAFYHADLHDKDKRQIQQMWMENNIKIIIATIAFGMGINKPDVRFVIHNSLSKSLQNYYQESGRAGRDGLPAKCILFYQRSDRTALQTMILKNQYSSAASKMFSNRQLAQMVKYCEQKFLCRRKFQLNYLGQKDFDPSTCNKTCDNCIKERKCKQYQCIVHAKQIVKYFQFISNKRDRITKAQMINILKGKINEKTVNKWSKALTYDLLPKLQDLFKYWTNDQMEELFLELLSEQILKQNVSSTTVAKFGKITSIYVEYNPAKTLKFLDKVQTLPMRRQIRPQKPSGRGSSHGITPQTNFDDLFNDSEEEKQKQQKQTRSDYEDNNLSDSYDKIDFGGESDHNFNFDQFEYGNESYEDRANQIRLQNSKEKVQQSVKPQNSNLNIDQKRASTIDFLFDLLDDDENQI